MTEKQQKRFYFPKWNEVCRANCWKTESGKLKAEIDPENGSDWVKKVWRFARQLAATSCRGVTLDDLRHGAHIVALGHDKSSETMTNAELDKVMVVFRLLIDETDLDASMEFSNPEAGERRRQKYFIEHAAPEAYIDAVCKGKFAKVYQSPFWEDLPLWALRDLSRTLANRRASWHAPTKAESRNQKADRRAAECAPQLGKVES
jgi:hypothetical protein